MSNEPTGKDIAIAKLETAQFMVQKGLRVCDIRGAYKHSGPVHDFIDPAAFRSALPEKQVAAFGEGSFEDYMDAVLVKYDKVRNYPADIAVFTAERAALTAGYGAMLKVARDMDSDAFDREYTKQPTAVIWDGVERNAFELANELMTPTVAAWAEKLDTSKDVNALYKFCNALARSLGKTGTIRPAQVGGEEATTE